MKKFFLKKLYFNPALFCFILSVFLLAQGCLESGNTLMLKKDGSGQLEVKYILGEELSKELMSPQESEGKTPSFNPISELLVITEKNLREQFQGEGIKIEQAIFEKKENKLYVSYTLTFEGLQNLLATKALQKEEVSFYRDKNNNLGFQWETESIRKRLDTQKMRGAFSLELTLILPGKILDSNADQIEKNVLSWRCTQDKLPPEVLKATCEGTELTFLNTLPSRPKKITKGYVYDPTGKLDPFKPFIMEIKRFEEEAAKSLQPLQRYEISQLKLVGIIWSIDNPRALVEDAAGKGYIISKGSSIGKNNGEVAQISENEVTIIEELTDFFGEKTKNEVRLKLHKGEEERKNK